MTKVIDPSADLVWGAAGTVEDKTGSHDLSPKTEADWNRVISGAKKLAEGAKMLLVTGLPIAPEGAKSAAPGIELEPGEIEQLVKKNPQAFYAFANALREVAEEAERAARQKRSLFSIGSRLDAVCESCHLAFWYPEKTSAHMDFLRSGMLAKHWGKN